jgi:hypothetical protein
MIIFLVLLSFSALGYSAETGSTGKTKQLIDPNATGKLQLIIGAGASPKYLQEWVSTPASTPARVERIKECKPEQTVYIGFFVTGYSLDENMNVNCVVDVTIYKPNGQILFSVPKYAKAKGRYKENSFIALDAALDMTLESTDPEGTYRIEGVVTDSVSGNTTKAIYEIKFKKK